MTTNELSAAAAHARAHLTDAHAAALEHATSDYEVALADVEEARAELHAVIVEAREVFTVREIAERTRLSSARIAQITRENT